MKSRSYLIFFIYFIPDVLAILFSLIGSTLFAVSHFVIRGSKLTLFDVHVEYIFITACVVWYDSSKSTGLYNDPISKEIGQDVSNIFKNIAIQLVCLVIGLFVVKERCVDEVLRFGVRFYVGRDIADG